MRFSTMRNLMTRLLESLVNFYAKAGNDFEILIGIIHDDVATSYFVA